MTTYAIGDVQGCYAELSLLLEKIKFDDHHDSLWFVGDVVNRGPQSLHVLRLLYSLKDNAICVLGNHDFHLLAVAAGYTKQGAQGTLDDILNAPDRDELLAWLVQRPLLHHDAELGYTMVHAGIAAQWDLAKAMTLAHEIEQVLAHDTQRDRLFKHLYGDRPHQWSDELTGYLRWRCIINYFTRMRFCKPDGSLDLHSKGTVQSQQDQLRSGKLIPWYQFPARKTQQQKIIFGHWAALNGVTNTPNVFALDTGCVWGKQLTAMNLQTQELISVAAIKKLAHA